MQLFGRKDLFNRWVYTRQGVHKLTTGNDFPAPYLVVNGGRLLAWRDWDIMTYEDSRPELQNVDAKLAKTRSKASDVLAVPKPPISNTFYLGGADLTDRWCYSRCGAHWIRKDPKFPEPCFVFNEGRGKVWELEDIITYEKDYPELIDLAVKTEKIRRNAYIWSRWG